MSKNVTVKVPRMSGKNLSHRNVFTGKCGTLMPILFYEPPIGTKMKLRMALDLRLPPLASETFANVDYRCEAFFVPLRLLFRGFERWYSGNQNSDLTGTEPCPPQLLVPSTLTRGSLFDMLGLKALSTQSSGNYVTALPFIAYHLIWQEWYRNTLVQKPAFIDNSFASSSAGSRGSLLPYLAFDPGGVTPSDNTPYLQNENDTTCFDGVSIYSFRQRNFGYDYFTSATPTPQMGVGQSVEIATPESGNGYFSISALRAANSLQQFAERNNLAGSHLPDVIKARTGVRLSNSVAQRPVLLGSCSIPVYNVGVNQSFAVSPESSGSRNVFNSVGSVYGKVTCSGNELLIDDFMTEEPGYVFVMGSLVPRAQYSTGVSRQLTRYGATANSYVDNAVALLQNVGNQPVYARELSGSVSSADKVFGYQPRFSDWHKMDDEVHGLFVDGGSLDSYVLQRAVTGDPVISSSFLEIPTDYLNQIFSLDPSASGAGDEFFSYQADTYWDFRIVNNLSDYAIPSLQDPAYEHGRDVTVKVGGTQL